MRYVDLSHELADGMDPYPGLPAPRIDAHLDHEQSRDRYDGEEFYLGRVAMPGNVGTYLDAPFHRFRDGDDLSQLEPERLLGLGGVVVDCTRAESRELDPELPAIPPQAAVLIRTGWDSRWGSAAYWKPGPFLAESLGRRLIEANAGLVGVDCWNVDDTTTRRRPIHTMLLEAGIPIVEHLCRLDRLPPEGFRFFAPVLRIVRGASFPVRAFAELPDGQPIDPDV